MSVVANVLLQEEPEDYAFPLTLKLKSPGATSPLPGAGPAEGGVVQADGLTNGSPAAAGAAA